MDVKIEARNEILALRIEDTILEIHNQKDRVLNEEEFKALAEEKELIEFETHCLYSILKAIGKVSFERKKRVTREEFNLTHNYCPVCFNEDLLTTLVGYIERDDQDYEDHNSAQCEECGWSGTCMDLVEFQPEVSLTAEQKDVIIEEWRKIETDLSYLIAKRKMEECFYSHNIAHIRKGQLGKRSA
jgi:hypothetical protein